MCQTFRVVQDVDGDYKIIELSSYNVPEKIYDVSQSTKISFDDFLSRYLSKKNVGLWRIKSFFS